MFNENLINIRKQNNDTQESLARRLHVSRSLIAKWEQNKSFPNIEDLEEICKIYNIEFGTLMSSKELKEVYGIINDKNKRNKLIIYILIVVSSVLLTVLFFLIPLTVRTTSTVSQTKDFEVKNYEEKLVDGKYYFKMTLDNGDVFDLTKIQNDETELYVNGKKYKDISYFNCKSGSYVENITLVKNGYNKVVQKNIKYERISFRTYQLKEEDELIGVTFDLDRNARYEENEDTGIIKNYSLDKESVVYYYLLKDKQNDSEWDKSRIVNSMSSTNGLSSYDIEYKNIDLSFSLDINKYLAKYGVSSMDIKLFYIYADNTIRDYVTNVLTPNERKCEYIHLEDSICKCKMNDQIGNCRGKYLLLTNNMDVENKTYYLSFSFSITNYVTPTKYEIKSFDSNDIYLGVQSVTSLEEARSFNLLTGTSYVIINEYAGDKLKSSEYCSDSIYFHFTDEFGVKDSTNKKINLS